MLIGLKRIAIDIDPKTWFPGGTDNDYECRLVRQMLGLPQTKQLVFYSNKHDVRSMVLVDAFRIVEVYQTTDMWFNVEILTHNPCGHVHIHSAYLAEMQDRNFIKNMAKLDAGEVDA